MSQAARKPFLWVAAFVMLLTVGVEIGTTFFVASGGGGDSLLTFKNENADTIGDVEVSASSEDGPPGMGIPYLLLVDVFLLTNLVILALASLFPTGSIGRAKWVILLVVSILALIGAVIGIIAAFVLLLLMIGLFLAIPFGTLVYLALFGGFPQGDAATVIAIVFVLKVLVVVALILAQHLRLFLTNGPQIRLLLTSALATAVVCVLHGIVPGFLASITDAIAAIVVGILGVIYAIRYLVGAILALVKSATG